MRKQYKLLSILMALCFLMGCGQPAASTSSEKEGKGVEFFSADSVEKVLQDDQDISDIAKEPEINLLACKGEYENAQIIMCAKENIKEYDVKLQDLTCGEHVFSAENIHVYNEKYIEVTENYEGNGAPLGMYPDALLPMEKAVEYGENKVKSGNNQGIFFSFDVPLEQPAGVYKGEFLITYDGNSKTIPVTFEVANYQLSQTTHIKSKFNVSFYSYLGELDSTQDMLDKYINLMAEYRISPGTVVQGNDQSVQEHIDKAYELTQNGKMASFALPAPGMTNSQKILTINHAELTKYLNAVIDKCMDTYDKEAKQGFNLASKVMMTCGFIDEFNQTGTGDRVPYVLNDFHTAVYHAIQYIEENKAAWISSGISKAFVDEVYQSIMEYPLILSVPYDEQVVTWDNASEYKEYGDAVFCPYISEYDDEASREKYNSRDQQWAYICNNPKPPYATYHMEDTLTSARALGWQLFEYDIEGLFYWAIDLYAEQDIKGYQLLDDYYDTALRYTANGGAGACNGDGFLLYPGAPYGIDGPVASMRLETIRDGLEEYELLYALEKRYEELGYSCDDIVNHLSALLYTGTKVATNASRYEEAREMLIRLVEAAYEPYELVIAKVSDHTSSFEYVMKGAQGVSVSGEQVKATDNGYIITVPKTQEDNYLNFVIQKEEHSKEINFNAGRKTTVYEGAQLKEIFKQKDGKLTTQLKDNQLELTVGTVKGGRQSISLSGKEISSISNDTYKFAMQIANPDSQAKQIKMYVKFAKKSSMEEVTSFTIQASGSIDFSFTDFATYNFEHMGEITEICFYLETEKGNYPDKTIQIQKMMITQF